MWLITYLFSVVNGRAGVMFWLYLIYGEKEGAIVFGMRGSEKDKAGRKIYRADEEKCALNKRFMGV